ncbi:hypothetical protein OZ410_14205 [Robiginitalea sp. M366]|nr:hypothetical protein [Robiginitalea aestuariiviva]MDG1573479.1 hypothetical protein [Robiginitalea aestuariiviva]
METLVNPLSVTLGLSGLLLLAGCVTVFGRVQHKLRKRFGP